jgi:putative PEP-CTERM system histidine kinase
MAGELTTLPLIIGTVVFAVAAIGYAIVAILLLVAHPGTRQANWLVVALFVSVVWAVCQILLAWRAEALVSWLPLLDAVHLVTWLLFLSSLMLGTGNSRLSLTLGRLVAAVAVTLGVIVAGQLWLSGAGFFSPADRHFGQLSVLGLTLLGLFALEQIFRNANDKQRPFLRWLVGGIGALLIVDTFLYSQALLFRAIQPNLWAIGGLINAAAAPLILIAIKRQPDWGRELYVSRQLAFYTTALTGAGFYLFAMGIGGFLLGSREQAWGTPLQLLFLGLAAAVFVYGLYSADVRRWTRIFISKHFFRDRYDYRAEWPRLTRALAAEEEEVTLGERGLRALGDILSSPGGVLWIERAETDGFECVANFGSAAATENLSLEDEMVHFLRRTQWVVDTREYLEDPSKYGNAFGLEGAWLAKAAVIFPLIHGSSRRIAN